MLGPVGLAGCGRMGLPMLLALREGGFDAQGFDVRAAEKYGEQAKLICNNAVEFAQDIQVLISVVRDIPQTEALIFTEQNMVAQAKNLKYLVISSTLSPRYVTDLRARIPSHIALIDAPMSGAQIAAQERRLSFMLGGTPADLDRLQPLFAAMGNSFHPMGDFGAGMAAKVLNNLLAASNTAMTRLVLDWADTAGISQDKLLALINASSGQNWFASGFDDIEFTRDGYGVENTIGILEKDVMSALDAAPDGADIALPRAVIAALQKLTKI